MAAALFRNRAETNGEEARFLIESAGTWGVDGQSAAPHAEAVMAEHGLSLDGHIARTVSYEMIERADLVIVMTRKSPRRARCRVPRRAGQAAPHERTRRS